MCSNVNVTENIKNVQERIKQACLRADRNPSEVTLIAVSKTKPVSMIEECIENGITVFGENKAQELTRKIEAIDRPLDWHFIGHLQRNKVKYVVGNACLIHSVDSVRLAEAINSEAEKKNIVCDILAEVNVAGEESKFGLAKEEVHDFVLQISSFKNIKLRGLMTIAPYVEDSEENRLYFRLLRNLLIDINSKNIDNINMDVLSMGMTGDYEVAIEEGATMVRVGTGIFGDRHYA